LLVGRNEARLSAERLHGEIPLKIAIEP